MNQLKPGGRLIIPIGDEESQMLEQVDKLPNGLIERRSLFAVRFQSLIDFEKNEIKGNLKY